MDDETRDGAARESSRGRDWLDITDFDWAVLKDVPGLQYDRRGNRMLAHRSHAPLMAIDTQLGHAARCQFDTHSPDGRRLSQPWFMKAGIVLRDHQVSGSNFLFHRKGTILADEMRTGKTLTTLLTYDPATEGPLVVVGPLAAREVWTFWMKRLWPHMVPMCLEGRKAPVGEPYGNLIDVPLIFIHYDVFPAWVGRLPNPGLLVIDEAHALANWKPARTKSARELSTRSDRVILVTGTPMWNKPSGLYNLLACANPGAWGSAYEWLTRYASGRPGTYGFTSGEISNVEELKARLSEVMLRRTWSEVQADLPPITRSVETVPLTPVESHNVDIAVEELAQSRGLSNRSQIAAMARYRSIVAEYKVDAAVECARNFIDQGVSPVIWTWHRRIADEIVSRLGGGYAVHGGTSIQNREAKIAAWRAAVGAKIVAPLAITLAVGQVAIDLSASHHAIFAELDPTPAVMSQAEMRTFAPSRAMSSTYLVLDHPTERRLVEILTSKLEAAGKAGVPASEKSFDGFMSLFGAGGVDDGDLGRLAEAVLAGSGGDV